MKKWITRDLEVIKAIERCGKKNRGLFYDRTKGNLGEREKAFASHWEEENKKNPMLNSGQGILQNKFIIGEPYNYKRILNILPLHRLIVATVIQWLGSNCGFCFLEECLDKCGYRIVKK